MLTNACSTNLTQLIKRARVSIFPLTRNLGGDPYTTKASGGFWLEISSPCGERKWPVCFGSKNASHTSRSTADSKTWSLIGAYDATLKRDVIPILLQLEVTLGRSFKLVGKSNTACIAAVKRGYSPGS